jgi:PEP-CTERM motif
MDAICRSLLAAGTAAALIGITPAHATLQLAFDINGIPFACVDNAACDTNPIVGILDIANSVFAGVDVNGSIQVSTGTPANPGLDLLSTSSLSIVNTNGVSVTGNAAISDTDFSAPVYSWLTSGSGTFVRAAGATTTFNWYVDAGNAQGADTSIDTPGVLVDTFTHAALSAADSFSHDGAGPASLTGPFSITEQFSLNLPAGAELLSRGQTIILSVPEPSTWAMALIGFGFLGFAAFRRHRPRTVFQD